MFLMLYYNLKKADSEKGPTQIHDFERRSYSVIIHRENVLYD